ncbi:MAG: YihY/virulence factor BrkB family protein [Chloroflexota bacterium]|nr:YihY/virulence factor BrkB family protein [Chloroflexota bacterium]
MVAPAIATQAGRPANAFAEPLRRLPRRIRLAFLLGFRAISGFVRHDGLTWSAAMAFWLVLSLPPLLIAFASLSVELLGDPSARSALAEQVTTQLPAEGWVIRDIVEQEISLLSVAGIGSLVVLLFSGSRVFAAMVAAINMMWRHVDNEGWLRRQIVRGVMVMTVGALMLGSVLLQLGIVGASEDLGLVAGVLVRFVLPFLLVVAGLFLTYLLVPFGRATWRTALVGAVISAVLLRVAQLVFWFLLTGFIEFDTAYGPVAGVAALMTWAVVASGIVLLGAELVATMDRHRVAHLPLPSSAHGEPSEQNA